MLFKFQGRTKTLTIFKYKHKHKQNKTKNHKRYGTKPITRKHGNSNSSGCSMLSRFSK